MTTSLLRETQRFIGDVRLPGTVAEKVVVALLAAAALTVAAVRLRYIMLNPIFPGEDWRTVGGRSLVDYRDLIYGPGQFLRAGGNPYDPDTYLAATPGSLEFDPYAPVWLLLSVPLSALPYLTGAAIYEVGTTILLAGFSALTIRLAPISRKLLFTVLLFLYLLLWYPSRTAAEHGSSLLAAFGTVLALGYFRRNPWIAGSGIALALIKPQFGVPIVVCLLVIRGWPAVWRGLLLLTGGSLPALVWCVSNAGGIPRFVDAAVRDLQQAGSANNSGTGLASPFLLRIDLVGVLARLGSQVPPGWVQVAAPIIVLAGTVLALRRTHSPLVRAILIQTTTLLVVVHQPYDLVLIAPPAVWTLAMMWDRPWKIPGVWTVASGLTLVAIMVHVHAVDRLLVPDVSDAALILADGCLVAMSWLAAVVAGLQARDTHPGVRDADHLGADDGTV